MNNYNRIKLSDYVVSWLSNKGITTIFTVSGGGSILYRSCFWNIIY